MNRLRARTAALLGLLVMLACRPASVVTPTDPVAPAGSSEGESVPGAALAPARAPLVEAQPEVIVPVPAPPVPSLTEPAPEPVNLEGIETRILVKSSGPGEKLRLSLWVDISWAGEGEMQVSGVPAPNLMGQMFDGEVEGGGFGDGCAANIDPSFDPVLKRGQLRSFGPRELGPDDLPPSLAGHRIELDVGLCQVQLADGRWRQLHAGTVTFESQGGGVYKTTTKQLLRAD